MFRARFTKLFSLLPIAVLLASCGNDTPGSSSSELLPRQIGYKNLAGQIKGNLLEVAIAQSFAADCQAGISCLSSSWPHSPAVHDESARSDSVLVP